MKQKQAKLNDYAYIDWKAFFWELLSQWKASLLFALLLGALLSAALYKKQMSVAKNEPATEDEMALTESEMELDSLKARKDSVLMGVDYSEIPHMHIVFFLNNIREEDYVYVINRFNSFCTDQVEFEILKKYYGKEDLEDIDKLFMYSTESSNSTMRDLFTTAFTIDFIIKESSDETDAITKEIRESVRNLFNDYDYSISGYEENSLYAIDGSVKASQEELENKIEDLENQLQASQKESGESVNDTNDEEVTISSVYVLKNFGLGVFSGIVLYAVIFLAVFYCRNVLYDGRFPERVLDIYDFGKMQISSRSKRLHPLFESKIITQLKNRFCIRKTVDEIGESIMLFCKMRKIDRVAFLFDNESSLCEAEEIQELNAMLRRADIRTNILNTSPDDKIKTMTEIRDCENVVFVISAGETKAGDFDALRGMACRAEAVCVGTVTVAGIS